MKKILYAFTAVAVAGMLTGCGKEVPSCGDKEATDMVGNILASHVLKDTNDLKDEIQQRFHFSVDQAIIVQKDDALSSYSCKAVASYHVADKLVDAVHRATTDANYQAVLFRNWRKLMGLYSVQDVGVLVTQYADAKTDSTKAQLRGELVRALGVNDNGIDDQNLGVAVLSFATNSGHTKELEQQANLMQKTLDSADTTSKNITLPVEYTISKIDGQKKFKIDARSDQADLIDGIQNIEVLQSAVLITAQESTKPSSGATNEVSEKQQPRKVAEATESQPVPTPASTVVASDVPESHASQSDDLTKPETVPQPKTAAPAPEPAVISRSAVVASFDCSKASSKIEKLICSSPETADADRRLSDAYRAAASKSADQSALKQQQRDWLTKERNACGDATCLVTVTEARINALAAM